ncbi:Zinc finger CCHC domain-containing protein 3 [Holothuria leucospilota]|uniref:Zinc finger CCHC domain-containing protein 3 n=1 Tax=Holothuria leucospilota TaxID=206669 RepID=A0A9Q1C7C9_HOLLE|nr:Zinc finger CCHC domain-containing protein 3 [Holothuria leucospilota]
MATLKRDASVQLRLQNCDGSSSVLKFLKDVGVDPATHLVAVQKLPGRYYDVTFKTIEFKRRFWPALCSDRACEVNPYTSSATLVTVLHVAHELDDNTVRYVLGRYGKVISGGFLTFKDYPSIFNGIRHYLIALKSDIPSAIRLGGRDCWVRYGGQPRTCLKCGGKGHDAKDCNQIRCHRCQGLGHVFKDCKMDEFCTVCQKEGHNYRNCPVSFANKIAPTPMKWTFGNPPQNSDEVNDKAVNANKGTEQNSQMDTDSEATQENVSESTETVTESQVAVANDRVTSANKLAEHSSPMDIDQGATHQTVLN